ncbi:MAG: DUF2927 domain-containing protein [Lachnospiraceae bacterium]|nr:DUF2927 domain-containing protein [Lachnospiraceae bacterium]
MKKRKVCLAFLIAIISLSGCSPTFPGGKETVAETETTEPVEETTEEETTAYSVEEVIHYFCEVVLASEYSTGTGDPGLVQKWMEPIHYRIYGEATDQDRQVLLGLFDGLNEIEGFPGIFPAGENDVTDLALYFYDQERFNQNFGHIVSDMSAEGAVEYWYWTDTNVIYDARIGYRMDIDQLTRNSVLLEEVVNGLGITDTVLREDSITYQDSSQTQELSEMDWLIIELLYSPEIKCGMDRAECEAVLIQLLND